MCALNLETEPVDLWFSRIFKPCINWVSSTFVCLSQHICFQCHGKAELASLFQATVGFLKVSYFLVISVFSGFVCNQLLICFFVYLSLSKIRHVCLPSLTHDNLNMHSFASNVNLFFVVETAGTEMF